MPAAPPAVPASHDNVTAIAPGGNGHATQQGHAPLCANADGSRQVTQHAAAVVDLAGESDSNAGDHSHLGTAQARDDIMRTPGAAAETTPASARAQNATCGAVTAGPPSTNNESGAAPASTAARRSLPPSLQPSHATASRGVHLSFPVESAEGCHEPVAAAHSQQVWQPGTAGVGTAQNSSAGRATLEQQPLPSPHVAPRTQPSMQRNAFAELMSASAGSMGGTQANGRAKAPGASCPRSVTCAAKRNTDDAAPCRTGDGHAENANNIRSAIDWDEREREAWSTHWLTLFTRWVKDPSLVEREEPGVYVRAQSDSL